MLTGRDPILRHRFVFYILTTVSILTVGFSVVARRVDAHRDPFTLYADVIAGELNSEFICRDATYVGDEMDAHAARQLCDMYLTDGPFSQVTVLVGEQIYRVYFTLQGQVITIGDLANLWGRPVMRLGRSPRMVLRWSAQGVVGEVSTDGPFSYFLPLERVVFARNPHNLNLVIAPSKLMLRTSYDQVKYVFH